MDNEITFNGFPVIFEIIDGEVYITCKGVTGTLTEMHKFFTNKSNLRKKFGISKIRRWNKNLVRVDCLEDTIENAEKIYKNAKKIKNDDKSN